LYRDGGTHSIWFNPTLHKIARVPRHREIKEGTVRAIYKQLEIPRHPAAQHFHRLRLPMKQSERV
jgi:hypothetical protein